MIGCRAPESVRSCRRIEWCRLQCPVPSTAALKLRFPPLLGIAIWLLGAYGPQLGCGLLFCRSVCVGGNVGDQHIGT